MGYGSVPVHAVPASPLSSVQFNDGGVFGGDQDFTWDKTTNALSFLGANTFQLIQAVTTDPSAPAAGRAAVFVQSLAGRPMFAQRSSTNMAAPFSPYLGHTKNFWWNAIGNNTTASVVGFGNGVTGTATARVVATANLFQSLRRLGFVSAAGAGQSAGTRHNLTQFWRGNIAGAGGFMYSALFGISLQSGGEHRAFVGFWGTVGAFPNADPSAQTDIVGMGADVGDTEWQIIHNDAAGVATKVPLGVNFPFPGTVNVDCYELFLYAAPNGSEIYYHVFRRDTGAEAKGTLVANLPTSTALMQTIININNGATAAAVAIDVSQQWLETDM